MTFPAIFLIHDNADRVLSYSQSLLSCWDVIHVLFNSVWILGVELLLKFLRGPLRYFTDVCCIFHISKSSCQYPGQKFFLFAKGDSWTGFRSHVQSKRPISKCACKQINKRIMHSLVRLCVDMDRKNTV